MARVTTTPLAVSADYADALLTARRAKNWVFLFLLLGLLAQITIFCLARFTNVVTVRPGAEPTLKLPDVDVDRTPAATTTAPATAGSDVTVKTANTSVDVNTKEVGGGVLAWLTNGIVYAGSILSVVNMLVILLIVLVMLVGRLIGVSHTTSAYVWAVVLALLLFPWQLFYGPETADRSAHLATATHRVDIDDFRVPGAFYTWGELEQGLDFGDGFDKVAVLRYTRFLAFPLVTLIMLFMVQAKSGRGVKYALGEAEVHVDVTTTDV